MANEKKKQFENHQSIHFRADKKNIQIETFEHAQFPLHGNHHNNDGIQI